MTKNIAGVNPLSNKFVLKESENNLNLALAHLNMPNAQQALQQPQALQVSQQKTATIGEAEVEEDIEMKKDAELVAENESPEPAKKAVCQFNFNSCSKKSKNSPSEGKSDLL